MYPNVSLDHVTNQVGQWVLKDMVLRQLWVDGTIYAPSYFGQVDTSTNRWVPKALAGITWGTNGFYQDYADSDNLGDDESGNGNDFTNNGHSNSNNRLTDYKCYSIKS